MGEMQWRRTAGAPDYSDITDVHRAVSELVPDETMRGILFMNRNFTPNVLRRDMVKFVRNIIGVAFVMVFSRWKQVYDDPETMGTEKQRRFRASRFSALFGNVCGYDEITFDLMVFSLIEVWVNTRVDLDNAPKFNKMFSPDKEGIGVLLQEALKICKVDEEVARDVSAAYLNEIVYNLLESFLIFSEAHFLPDRADYFEFTYKLNNRETVTLNPNALFGNSKLICHKGYFAQLEGGQGDPPVNVMPYIRYAVSSFGGESKVCYRTFNEEYFYTADRRDVDRLNPPCSADGEQASVGKKTGNAVRQLMVFNYRQLRDYALVISDAVIESKQSKEKIFKLYKDKYPTVFPKGIDYRSEDMNWDNVITLLLVEEGLRDFLNSVMEYGLFERVLKNIACRYLDDSAYDELSAEYERGERQIEAKFSYNTQTQDVKKAHLMARIVSDAMSINEKSTDSAVDISMYEESLAVKYDRAKGLIRDLSNTDLDLREFELKRSQLEKILKEVLSFLQIFYEGLDGYATSASGDRHQFVYCGRRKYKEIKNMQLSELYESFHAQCEEYNSRNDDGAYMLKPKAQRLKKFITRTYICDVKKLEFFVSVPASGYRPETNIFDMVQNLNKFLPEADYAKYLGYVKDFLIFLVYNDDCTDRGLVDVFESGTISDSEIDPIYPYLVSYYQQSIDRDKYKRCAYKAYIPLSKEGDSMAEGSITITLLTDCEYKTDVNYFCMPLKYGSTGKWWIDPFMIQTDVFGEILKEK